MRSEYRIPAPVSNSFSHRMAFHKSGKSLPLWTAGSKSAMLDTGDRLPDGSRFPSFQAHFSFWVYHGPIIREPSRNRRNAMRVSHHVKRSVCLLLSLLLLAQGMTLAQPLWAPIPSRRGHPFWSPPHTPTVRFWSCMRTAGPRWSSTRTPPPWRRGCRSWPGRRVWRWSSPTTHTQAPLSPPQTRCWRSSGPCITAAASN